MAKRKQAAPRPERPAMKGCGIESSRRGLLPWKWAEQRLSKTHNFWLATTRADGRPHCMAVQGIWFRGAFYFATGRDSVKRRNLLGTPYCVVCTESASEPVVLEGETQELAGELQPKLLAAFLKKYHYPLGAEPGRVFIVSPRVAFGMVELQMVKTATRWTF